MPLDPISMNIAGVQNLVGSRINKTADQPITSQQEGIQDEKIDEFELNMSDAELLLLSKKWEAKYAPYESKLKLRQKENETYYLGLQKQGTIAAIEDGKGISSNLLFEAEETFLPAALSRNPEPVVWSDNSEQGNAIADAVKTMLQYHADALVIRRKLNLTTRKWSLDFLGCLKHGWDDEIEDIKTEVRDVKNMIFDPNGYVDAYGDFIGYLGERITVTASRLIEMFPKHTDYITVMVSGKLGTDVSYTEWWTDDYCFYTFKDVVLDKNKNPHFNYDRNKTVGMEGEETEEVIKGLNHFARPKKPYTFLSVFTLGDRPHDITGLIEQNIPNQRLITRRTEQIDYNITRTNHSRAYSENNFNQETAKQASTASMKGHDVLVPAGGPIEAAIKDFPPTPIPPSFFQDLQNNTNNLRSIFGTQGITASQQDEDQTARGMILQHQYDNSRISGGIGDAIQQVADNVFNWWTQLYHVYYDEPHFASVIGQLKATQYIEMSSQNLTAHLIVSVAPDSMKPHDEITTMNQALELWKEGALDIQTLLKRLNFPDPKETAGQVMLYKTDPVSYMKLNFPDIVQQIQAANPPMVAGGVPAQGGSGVAPEQVTEPAPPLGGVPANASLSNVELPKV